MTRDGSHSSPWWLLLNCQCFLKKSNSQTLFINEDLTFGINKRAVPSEFEDYIFKEGHILFLYLFLILLPSFSILLVTVYRNKYLPRHPTLSAFHYYVSWYVTSLMPAYQAKSQNTRVTGKFHAPMCCDTSLDIVTLHAYVTSDYQNWTGRCSFFFSEIFPLSALILSVFYTSTK